MFGWSFPDDTRDLIIWMIWCMVVLSHEDDAKIRYLWCVQMSNVRGSR